MSRVCIVTDSTAQFEDPTFVKRHGITVASLNVHLAGQVIPESQFSPEDFFRRLAHSDFYPTLSAPSVDEFVQIYSQLCQKTDQILSLHQSSRMSQTWRHAHLAAQSMLGRCHIDVVDSRTTSVALAYLVEIAARAAARGEPLESVVRVVRGNLSRVYVVFCVESLRYIQRAHLIGEAQAALGAMLGIRPFLTIEEGELITMEKVRTRSQAVDKLVEFVTEFSQLDRLVILQNTPFITEQTRMLQDRLAAEFQGRNFPVMLYGPSLGSFIGPDGLGVAVFEGRRSNGAPYER